MSFCSRHHDALLLAVGSLGLKADLTFDPVTFARQAIVDHATNFAGKASVEMLTRGYCPICFVNRAIAKDGRNRGLTVDGWVDNAADEALNESVRRRDSPAPPVAVAVH